MYIELDKVKLEDIDSMDSYLSEDAQEVLQVIKNFSYYFFNGDMEELKKYLWVNYEWDVYVNENAEIMPKFKTIKGLAKIDVKNMGDKCHVSLEFVNENIPDDSNSYLEMGLIKTEEGWKITDYGIEK